MKHHSEYLFKPDIFSKPGPIYIDTDETIRNQVYGVISSNYLGIITRSFELQSIKRVGGNELNSRNFAVFTEDCNFIVKRLPNENIDRVVRLTQLHRLLSGRVNVPCIVRNSTGKYYTEDSNGGGGFWVVMQLVDGMFYSGELIEPLNSIATQFHNIHTEIDELAEAVNNLAFDTIQILRGDERELWDFFLEHQTTLETYLTGAAIKSITKHKSKVQEILHSNCFFEFADHDNTKLCHIDWHPYNLLVNDSKVSAILDIDSINYASRSISTAFGAYKFLRQFMVYNKTERDRAVHTYIIGTRTSLSKNELIHYAQIELLRRIFIILRLGFRENNTEWAHVLPMHIAGLYETDYIFNLLPSTK